MGVDGYVVGCVCLGVGVVMYEVMYCVIEVVW